MKSWQTRSSKYFYLIAATVLAGVLLFILADSIKSRQIKQSIVAYMDNLRDMVFMSTYDSLKKGNMKLFRSHLEEVGSFADVVEFSLLNTKGVIDYSSNPDLVKGVDLKVMGLEAPTQTVSGDFVSYYFPVETTNYCSRCHVNWRVGAINSYYKLTLSRAALATIETNTLYYHGFTVGSGGVLIGCIYLLFTLYERRKHEEQMHLSASVFENAVEAIAITTFDGLVEKVNPAFTQITGFAEEEILGQAIQRLNAGDVNRQAYQEMRAQIQQRGFWCGELWNLRKTGDQFAVRLSVTAVRNVHGRITHYISVFYDISARKEAERLLLEMNQIKSEFISAAAHELRTPLSAILGFAEIARNPQLFGGFTEEQIQEFLDEIYDRGEALSQIIDDLLDIGRIESGKPIELKFESCSLAEILGKALEFHRIRDKKHRFVLEVPASLPNTNCLVDRYRINQVLENLLSNAVKYSKPGTDIRLGCHLQGDCWEISVADQGIGMTPEQVERVFDKFYRVDASNTAVGGLGLGMSIARQIVESHGGSIGLTSAVGEGTTVTVRLPANG